MNIDFFKSIYNEDIIYHYTKASTAIDFILYNNQLKFSSARKSMDPIESIKPRRSTVYSGSEVDRIISEQQFQDENELHSTINYMEEQFNQICFCQNRMGEDFASKDYISNFEGHEELFGFSKLRMWDQYADKFSGVCIAFSKEKILSLNYKKIQILDGNVKYLTFQDLSLNKIGNIHANYLVKVGKEEYKKQLQQRVNESFFYKHIDYLGETEYRIGTLFEKDKCSFEIMRGEIFYDRTMMCDISGCVKAIFVSSYANDKQKKNLLEYALEHNVEIIEMQWQHKSFEACNYKRGGEIFNSLKDQNK